MTISTSIPFLAMTLLLTGCASTPFHQVKADFALLFSSQYVAPFKAGDAATWSEVFAANAVALHDRRSADVGREAITEFGKMVAQHLKVDRFDIQIEQVQQNGNWAFTRGSFSTRLLIRSDGKDSGLGGEGKFFILWAKQSDGQWKIIIDMGNRKS